MHVDPRLFVHPAVHGDSMMPRRSFHPGKLTLMLFISVWPSIAQDSRPGTTEVPAVAVRHPSADAAQALLRRAVAVQTPSGQAPVIDSFESELSFTFYEYDPKTGAKTTSAGDITQSWSREPGDAKGDRTAYRRHMSTDLAGSGTMVIDYDGTCWKPNPKTDRIDVMSTKEWEEDRERLRVERRRCSQLLALFFLANLDDRQPELRVLAEGAEVKFSFNRKPFTFKTTALAAVDRAGNRLTLWIDDAAAHLVKARVTYAEEQGTTDSFHLAEHQPFDVPGSTQKVMLPTWIQYMDGERVLLEVSARKRTALRFNGMGADERLALFKLPED